MKLWSNSNVPKGNGGFNPERRLLSAILQRAITDFLSGDEELETSAKDWLFGEDDIHSFGFTYICEALDFHQAELRKAILRQFNAANGGRSPYVRAELDAAAAA
jgi:hypothetical protein